MSANDSPTGSEEAVFVALQAKRGLKTGEVLDRPVMFGELVHYLQGTAAVDEGRIQGQLNTNLDLLRQFNQLLSQCRVATAPQQAQAASAEPLNQRETRAFSVTFTSSRANTEQVYVLLTLHPESGLDDGHEPVLLVSKADKIGRLCFPAIKDHTSQLLFLAGDDKLSLVRDPNAELSLL